MTRRREHIDYQSDIRSKMNWMRHKVYPVIAKRDGEQCAKCGSKTKLQVDHIKPVSNGGGNELYNLRFLCSTCNKKQTSHTKLPEGKYCVVCDESAYKYFAHKWVCKNHYADCQKLLYRPGKKEGVIRKVPTSDVLKMVTERYEKSLK